MATPLSIGDDPIYDEIAADLHYAGGQTDLLDQAPSWGTIVPAAHAEAAGRIWRRLTTRGYLPTQIQAWDDLPTFEQVLAVGDAFIRGGAIDQAPQGFWDRFNRLEAELFDPGILILIGGVPQAPQGVFGVAAAGSMSACGLLPSGWRDQWGFWGEGY